MPTICWAAPGTLSLGGGLARDGHFGQFLATLTGSPVARGAEAHAGLRGLAAVGMRLLFDADPPDAGAEAEDAPFRPEGGLVAAYAGRKYSLFLDTVAAAAANWGPLAALRAEAGALMEDMG